MFDTLGHNHAFFLVRILLNGKAKEGKKQEDTDYYALVFTDTYKNSIHLENEDIRYRERVTPNSVSGAGMQSTEWGTNPAPALTGILNFPVLPPNTNPFPGRVTIRYIYDRDLAKKSTVVTLAGFAKVDVESWTVGPLLHVYSIPEVQQRAYNIEKGGGSVTINVLYVLTTSSPPKT